MSIGVKICKYVDLGQKHKKNLGFGQNFRKYRFWWKLSKNLKFGQICRTISILDNIVENYRFCSKSKKKSILVKRENVYFSLKY